MDQSEFDFDDDFDDDQNEQIKRVTSKIGLVVLAFCREVFRSAVAQGKFHASDLRIYVAARELVAPASPDRILRFLRQLGWIDYEVIDRRASYYLIKWVRRPGVDVDLIF
jgi:hypothetical protein